MARVDVRDITLASPLTLLSSAPSASPQSLQERKLTARGAFAPDAQVGLLLRTPVCLL